MSTKIYEGFQVSDLDYRQLHEEFVSLGEDARSQAEREFVGWFARTLVENNDHEAWRTRLGMQSDGPTTYFQVMELYRERVKKIRAEMRRDPEVDWEFTVSFAPTDDGRWLGIPFCEKSSLIDLLKSRAWYGEYAYWNNTDRPDGVTEEEWESRRSEWDRVLGSGIPARHMASFQFVCDMDLGAARLDDIVSSAPGDDERVQKVIEEASRHKYVSGLGELKAVHDVIEALFKFRDGFVPGGELWELRAEFEPLALEVVSARTPSQMVKEL
jgi:hypothetical protein